MSDKYSTQVEASIKAKVNCTATSQLRSCSPKWLAPPIWKLLWSKGHWTAKGNVLQVSKL